MRKPIIGLLLSIALVFAQSANTSTLATVTMSASSGPLSTVGGSVSSLSGHSLSKHALAKVGWAFIVVGGLVTYGTVKLTVNGVKTGANWIDELFKALGANKGQKGAFNLIQEDSNTATVVVNEADIRDILTEMRAEIRAGSRGLTTSASGLNMTANALGVNAVAFAKDLRALTGKHQHLGFNEVFAQVRSSNDPAVKRAVAETIINIHQLESI